MNGEYNINGSSFAIEGITSKDGRIFGKMGHSERYEENLFKNIYGNKMQDIFKNGVVGFKLQALNEFVCMKTAERAGVPTAHVDYRLFEDEPALIIERYDRTIGEDGTILRAHQEDLCQALGVMPFQKYTADGGPAVHDVLTLLGTTPAARLNMLLFTLMLFFSYLRIRFLR